MKARDSFIVRLGNWEPVNLRWKRSLFNWEPSLFDQEIGNVFDWELGTCQLGKKQDGKNLFFKASS